MLAGNKTKVMKGCSEMFIPQLGCNGQSILTFVKPEACLSWTIGMKATRQVNPYWVFQFGLQKGIGEVNIASCPSKSHRQHQKQADRSPGNNRSKGFKVSFLEISSAAEASFAFLDFTVRSALASEDPSTWNDFAFGIRDVNFLPRSKGLE
jgi:hypothetical protein